MTDSHDGLKFITDLYIDQVKNEFDSALAIQLLDSTADHFHPLKKPIDDSRALPTEVNRATFKHIVRKANKCADILEKTYGSTQFSEYFS